MPNARRSNKVDTSKFFEKLDEIEKVLDENPETVLVMLMKSLVVKTTGEVTGKQYIFNGAGSIVNVDKKDLNGLLRSNQSKHSCCGSYSSPYFSLV